MLRTGLRLTRMAFYLLLATVAIPLMFSPMASRIPQKRAIISFIYRRFYRVANIELKVTGTPIREPALWVCNHISWMDVLILAGDNTLDFLAKSEVASWPLVGKLVEKAGTLFVDRSNKFQAYRALPELQKRIRSGTPVVVFPEGTTSDGQTTLPFKPMFYQAAVRENLWVQPVSLRYENSDGSLSAALPFIDDDTFFTSLMRIVRAPKTIAHVHYLAPMTAREWHRKAMAKTNQEHIDQLIQGSATKNSLLPSCYG